MGLIDRLKKKNISKEAKPKARRKPAPGASDLVSAKGDTTGRALKILLRPLITEKSANLEKSGQYVFAVASGASKKQISRAVQSVFELKPLKVNIIKVKGKFRRRGAVTGFTKNWKKAIITLPEGKALKLTKESPKEKT